MTYFNTWEEFAKATERLYINDPSRCRFVIKYRHSEGKLVLKMTDDRVFKTEQAQDVKKLEKLTSQLMRHMASKEK